MRLSSLRVDPIDALGVIGLGLLALGVGIRVGWDVAAGVVGVILIIFAVALAASRSAEVSS